MILDGALALAIPTSYGQSLTVEPNDQKYLEWKSLDHQGKVWFEAELIIDDALKVKTTNDNAIAARLLQILNAAKNQNPEILGEQQGITIVTKNDFPKNWGLGTSSTLINNIAQWSEIDAYTLLKATFGGSGYDIACAKHNAPLTYQLEAQDRTIIERTFNPVFQQHLYFVFLNKKQNSRDGIAAYQNQKNNISKAISEITTITNAMLSSTTLETFQFLMDSHESIIANIIKQQPVKERLFSDFKGSIKSLGAWGGDFVLVASKAQPEAYFKDKGYHTIIPYAEMVL